MLLVFAICAASCFSTSLSVLRMTENDYIKCSLVSFCLTVEDVREGVGFGCISGTDFWDPEFVIFSIFFGARQCTGKGKLLASRPSNADGEFPFPARAINSHPRARSQFHSPRARTVNFPRARAPRQRARARVSPHGGASASARRLKWLDLARAVSRRPKIIRIAILFECFAAEAVRLRF